MATRKTILEVDLVSDPSKVVSSFEDAGNAATDMGRKIDAASKVADDSAGRVDRAADATDNLASKSSQATGGLGALASGCELGGLGPYAAGLQSAAMATDFFSGVGDIANLVLQSQAVQTAKNTVLKAKDIVVTGAQRAATVAATVATNAQTIAMKALNLVMRANPIGLIITGITLLIGLFLVLYKRNTAFRELVNKVMSSAREAIGRVINAISSLASWIRDKAVLAFKVWKTLVVGYLKLVTLPIRTLISVIGDLIGWVRDKLPGAFSFLRDRVQSIVTTVRDKIGGIIDTAKRVADWVRTNLASAFTTARDKIKAPIDTVLGYIQGLIDKVQDLIGWIKDIKLPKLNLPDVNPFSKAGTGSAGSSTTSGPDTVNVHITINGAIDPASTAAQIRDLLKREGLWTGQLVTS